MLCLGGTLTIVNLRYRLIGKSFDFDSKECRFEPCYRIQETQGDPYMNNKELREKYIGRSRKDIDELFFLDKGFILQILSEGAAITADYNPQRIRAFVNTDNIITDIQVG